MKPITRNLSALILCVLLLTACKPRFELRLASSDEKLPSPRFIVIDPMRPGERPRYDTIKLADASSGELYWHLRAEPFGTGNSVASFSYAEKLPGFAAVVGPRPLEPNREYAVGVIGVAFGTLRFRVTASGAIQVVE